MNITRLYPYALVIAAFAALLGAAALSSKAINTYAGDGTAGYAGDGGPATAAQLDTGSGIAVADNGDVYIADSVNEVIRKVDFITGDISTVAGGGLGTNGDGLAATAAFLNTPQAVCVNAAGDIFIAATMEHRIRKVTNATGIISTIGGDGTAGYSGDGGAALSAKINSPAGIAVDSGGNVIFSDTANFRIRKITPGGTISTIAGTGTSGYTGDGGSATIAQITTPQGIFIDSSDNIYFVDRGNHVIRKFTDGGNISTIGGVGTNGYTGDEDDATLAEFDNPRGVWVEENGDGFDSFYSIGFDTAFGSTESGVAKQQIATQVTLATDGTATDITAYVQNSDTKKKAKGVRYAIYTDVAGEPDTLVAETNKVNQSFGGAEWFTLDLPNTALTSGTYWLALAFADDDQFNTYDAAGGQTRYVGNDAAKNGYLATWGASDTSNTRRLSIYAKVLDPATGTIVYVADTNNSVVRKFLEGGLMETVAGSTAGFGGDGGAATSAKLDSPEDVALDSTGNILIGDTQNHRIRKVDDATSNISTYGGTGTVGYSGDGGAATLADMDLPTGLFVDGSDDLLLADSNNHVIRKIVDGTGIITVVAGTPQQPTGIGDGLDATLAILGVAEDVAIDSSNNLYIAATAQNRIRKVDGATGIISTIAGTGVSGYSGDAGLATLAQIQTPRGVAIDDSDNIYIADTDNSVIRKFLEGGVITTVAGNGTAGHSGDGGLATAAMLDLPRGVEVDAAGNIYIADTENNMIRRVDEFSGVIERFAGDKKGKAGYTGDGGLATAAKLKKPYTIQIDDDGKLYIVDTQNSAIRIIDTTGYIRTIVGTGAAGYSGDGGPAYSAVLNNPGGIGFKRNGFDRKTDFIFVSDTLNNRVRHFPVWLEIVSWQEIEP